MYPAPDCVPDFIKQKDFIFVDRYFNLPVLRCRKKNVHMHIQEKVLCAEAEVGIGIYKQN
jgi:hypothetical protein